MALFLFFFAVPASARAARITGVTAASTMGSGFGTNINNTVNGVGLASPSLTATHSGTQPTNSWVGTSGTTTGQITFNLNGTYQVDGFSFWNQNGGGPGGTGSTGIQNVTVQYSSDGGTTFVPLPGGPTSFLRVTCTNANPEIFNFTAVSATHFRLVVASNYGDTFCGFAEIAFNDSATGAAPPPGPTPCGGLPPGVTVVQSFGSTGVTEGGPTDTYTVVLNSAPTATVTININPGAQVTVAPATLTFTPANFNVARTVTVTAVDDALVEGPHTGTITHSSTSTDPTYNGISVASVTVNITDNDTAVPPQPPITPSAGGEGSFLMSAALVGQEGSFGRAAATQRAAIAEAPISAPRNPILRGPFADGCCGSSSVLNVSHRETPSAGQPGTRAAAVHGLWLIAAIVALLLSAGVFSARRLGRRPP